MTRIPLLLFLTAAVLTQGCDRRQTPSLNLFAWSEYVPQEVIEGFTKETGVKVNYETYDSNEAMITKLSQGSTRYDLIQPSEYAVENLIRRNMLEPLGESQIPNTKNLDEAYRNPSYDPGLKYSRPYMAGTVGIVVNSDIVKDPIRGFADVFQPKYRGRIVAVNDDREIVSWAFDVLKIPINDVTPANLQKARPLIKSWLSLVKVFDSDNPRAPLLSGDCDIGVVYSGDAAKLYEQNHKFRYILPEEGAHQFVDSLCIPRGAAHKEAAEQFINYILRPEVSKIISDKFPYTNPNAEARKLSSKEQLDNPASYPRAGHVEVFHDIGPATQQISAMMTELRSG
ncbi:MAG TPA: spermidine/putrescine ABC transporter substrate-binding protein [Tepidisphaeraceae bacterium]|nr:spermidine/putrescine ABC transporter substrate-binding protein [Tepidisphaeraceae bacterium]